MNKIKPTVFSIFKGKYFMHKSLDINGLEAAYVGSGSVWENPYKVKMSKDGFYHIWLSENLCTNRTIEIAEAIIKEQYNSFDDAKKDSLMCYAKLLFPYEHKNSDLTDFFISKANIESVEKELKGKNLAVKGKLENNFHADYLIEIAN